MSIVMDRTVRTQANDRDATPQATVQCLSVKNLIQCQEVHASVPALSTRALLVQQVADQDTTELNAATFEAADPCLLVPWSQADESVACMVS